MPQRRASILLGLAGLSACGVIRECGSELATSTLIFYTPITFCNGVYAPGDDGAEEEVDIAILSYRIDSIVNQQPVEAPVRSGFFYVNRTDRGYPTTTARLFETFPDPTVVPAGATVRDLGALALRAENATRTLARFEGGRHVIDWPTLIYDPSLRGDPRPYVTIDVSGRTRAEYDPSRCRLEDVLGRVESTP